MAANARRVADFLTLMNHPRLRAIWDPGNEQGDVAGGGAFPRGYETLKPWIVHVQIEDARRLPNGTSKSVRLGTGDVDYLGQLRALKRDGYRGYLSMEIDWHIRHEIPKEVVRQPKGGVFSAGGEEATRQCLESLRAMLQQV